MRVINSNSVYAFVLSEDEWYSATEQQREAWINQIMREGADQNVQYLNIAVQPEAVLSISPNPKRHTVWRHTFPTTAEDEFFQALLNVRLNRGALPAARMRAIAMEVFK